MDFPERLATLRNERGMTQGTLAQHVGIHVSQLRRYEAGNSSPTLDVLRKLAIALSVNAVQLLICSILVVGWPYTRSCRSVGILLAGTAGIKCAHDCAFEPVHDGCEIPAAAFVGRNLCFVVGNRVERAFGYDVAFGPEAFAEWFQLLSPEASPRLTGLSPA
jgi:DNA-binding XRE family transcriptional regulator